MHGEVVPIYWGLLSLASRLFGKFSIKHDGRRESVFLLNGFFNFEKKS